MALPEGIAPSSKVLEALLATSPWQYKVVEPIAPPALDFIPKAGYACKYGGCGLCSHLYQVCKTCDHSKQSHPPKWCPCGDSNSDFSGENRIAWNISRQGPNKKLVESAVRVSAWYALRERHFSHLSYDSVKGDAKKLSLLPVGIGAISSTLTCGERNAFRPASVLVQHRFPVL